MRGEEGKERKKEGPRAPLASIFFMPRSPWMDGVCFPICHGGEKGEKEGGKTSAAVSPHPPPHLFFFVLTDSAPSGSLATRPSCSHGGWVRGTPAAGKDPFQGPPGRRPPG